MRMEKKEILTLWMSTSNGESSLLWQEMLETLRERGLKQVLLITEMDLQI